MYFFKAAICGTKGKAGSFYVRDTAEQTTIIKERIKNMYV